MSEISNQKLNTLAEALYPIFLDRLKNEGHLLHSLETPIPAPIQQNASHLLKRGIFMPEIDYVLHVSRLRGELRTARYTTGSGMMQSAWDQSKPYYAVHVHGGSHAPGLEHTLKEHILIPSAALKRDIHQKYSINHKHDYRLHEGSKTFYIKGVMDGVNNDPVKTNANCYVVDLRAQLTPTIIENTRQHWLAQSQYEKDMRIVTEETMMELLYRLENGAIAPNAIPWKLEVLSDGRDVKDDASFMPTEWDWAEPYKIGVGA